eukprot:3891334-Pyramimonas_sp.AAC.1
MFLFPLRLDPRIPKGPIGPICSGMRGEGQGERVPIKCCDPAVAQSRRVRPAHHRCCNTMHHQPNVFGCFGHDT